MSNSFILSITLTIVSKSLTISSTVMSSNSRRALKCSGKSGYTRVDAPTSANPINSGEPAISRPMSLMTVKISSVIKIV